MNEPDISITVQTESNYNMYSIAIWTNTIVLYVFYYNMYSIAIWTNTIVLYVFYYNMHSIDIWTNTIVLYVFYYNMYSIDIWTNEHNKTKYSNNEHETSRVDS
jgi:hypothetical protein